MMLFCFCLQTKESKPESDMKEADPIQKAEKDFFKIVEEEKAKKKKKLVNLCR